MRVAEHLFQPPETRTGTTDGSSGPVAYVEVRAQRSGPTICLSSDTVEHFLRIADAFQEAARLLRREQLRGAA